MRTIKKKAMSARILLPALLLASGLPAVLSCDKVPAGEQPGDTPIAFNSAVSTKAPVESEDDMTEFMVYGYYEDNGTYKEVFGQIEYNDAGSEPSYTTSGEIVRKESGNWIYDNLRYWIWDKEYFFYAVYPTGLKHAVLISDQSVDNGRPMLSVLDYDVKHENNDLMFAEVGNIIYGEDDTPQPVPLTFTHLLSRIEFIGKIDPSTAAGLPDLTATITQVSLYGPYAEGHFHSQSADAASGILWEFVEGTQTSEEAPFYESQDDFSLTADGVSIIPDTFIFPSADLSEYFLNLEWTVRTSQDTEPVAYKQTVPLASTTMRWEAGKRYKYTFSVSDTGRILFDRPTVEPWSDAVGGIIIVE